MKFTRLETIATRQTQTRVRDALFAALLTIATGITAVSVRSVCVAASTPAPTAAVATVAAR
jgi:hypothetical protein